MLERPELEQDAEPERRTPSARRRMRSADDELVGAVGREQQNPPVVEVVREEDDEIERRRIGPVQILEHEQHGRGGCAVGEQRERLLEHPQLRAGPLVDLPQLPERTQGLDERLVRQLRADEIDRAPEEDLEPRVAGTSRELGREPGLADARLPGDEDGRTASGLRRIDARSSSPSSRTRPTKTSLARASTPASIAHAHRRS